MNILLHVDGEVKVHIVKLNESIITWYVSRTLYIIYI